MYKTVLKAALPIVGLLALGLPLRAQLAQLAVVNAASFEPSFPLSPGCWGTAFADFASVGVTTAQSASTLPFPETLGGVQVVIGGVAAPISFVGPTQVNFLVPRATPDGRATLRVTVSGIAVYEGALQVFALSPGLISTNPGDPTKPGAILNQDGSLNSETNPARPNEVIQAFGIGADFAELPADGAAAPADRLIGTDTPTQAYVSVLEAAVPFSGLAPGLVNAWQLNVTVPDAPFVNGQVTLQAQISGVRTNLVTFWVAR